MATSPQKNQAKSGAEANSTAAAPNSTKKKVIIALAAIILAGGLGGGGWYAMSANNSAKPKVEIAITPIFVTFEPLTVNLKTGDNGDEYLQVSLTAQVGEKEHEDMLKLYMPQIRSRLLHLLATKTAEELATDEGKNKLTKEILEKIREPYSDKGPGQRIMNIFFTSFVIQ